MMELLDILKCVTSTAKKVVVIPMESYAEICSANANAANRVAAHYKEREMREMNGANFLTCSQGLNCGGTREVRSDVSILKAPLAAASVLAKNYDCFYKERHEAQFNIMMKYLNLQPDHLVVDLASGTGTYGEKMVETFKLKNPVWCVEPSSEMQEAARAKKGLVTIEKTAEEFLDDLDKQHRFNFALCVSSVHHFSDPVKVYKGVESCLTPDGVFMIAQMGEYVSFPLFKKAKNRFTSFVSGRKEGTSAFLRSANFEVEVSVEQLAFMVKKSKWYDMLRGRFHSTLLEMSDGEIEEGIDELDKGILQHANRDDDIPISMTLLIFMAKKK